MSHSHPDFDVVVAGAGGAGTTAALRAASAGLSVLLVDHLATFRRGCNTYLSTSMIPAAGTRWQMRLEIDDSPQNFYSDIMTKTHGNASATVARALTEVGAELLDWLADEIGVPLTLCTDFRYPGHSTDRCHSVPERSGRVLHGHMMAAVDAHPKITVAAPMALDRITLDAVGAVTAASVVVPGTRASDTVSTRAVVLGTGGFGANAGLVRRHIPEIADALYHGSEGCTGDAIRLGEAVGASTDYLDAYQGHGSVAMPERILVTWIAVMHGGVLVNSDGRRFGDETVGYSEFAKETILQPGAVAWVVLDGRIDRLCSPFQDYADLRAAGAIHWCADVRDVAARIGAPEAVAAETLGEIASFATNTPDPFGRTNWEAPLAPPYGLVRVTGALFHTQGGLVVDGNARVLRAGRPIPGLYAAGGAAIGISGRGSSGYLAGNGLLGAFGLGFLAGRHAVHADGRASAAR